jgi:hypothetical protein
MPRTKKSQQEKRVPLAIYVPPELLNRLKEAAEKDRRSMSTTALLILEEALQ